MGIPNNNTCFKDVLKWVLICRNSIFSSFNKQRLLTKTR